jgi:hypothetical protein
MRLNSSQLLFTIIVLGRSCLVSFMTSKLIAAHGIYMHNLHKLKSGSQDCPEWTVVSAVESRLQP